MNDFSTKKSAKPKHKRKIQPIDMNLIDRAYEYCRNGFSNEEEFLKYWQDNYVLFCENFARGAYENPSNKN